MGGERRRSEALDVVVIGFAVLLVGLAGWAALTSSGTGQDGGWDHDFLALAAILLSFSTLGLGLALARRGVHLGRERARRHRAELGLLKLERRLALVGAGVCVVDVDRRLLQSSRALGELVTGWPHVRAWWVDLREGLSQTAVNRGADRVEERSPVVVDLQEPVTGRARAFEITFGGKELELQGSAVLVRDVTDRQRMEAQLRVTDRLASIGTMAAGLAHEIHNPLQWLLSNLEVLRRELSSREPTMDLPELVDEAVEGAEVVRQIAADLRTMSHLAEAPQVQVDLIDVVTVAARMASPQFTGRAELSVDIAPALPRVMGVTSQLAQVVLNLLLNSAQALEPSASGHHIRVSAGPADGGVLLEVHDDGPGIPDHVQPSLFEPFFTTKPPGVGTGLGLYVCRRIVEEHGGKIDVRSSGEGTVARIWLPAVTPGALVVQGNGVA